jgi:hypothetical protein
MFRGKRKCRKCKSIYDHQRYVDLGPRSARTENELAAGSTEGVEP